MKNSISRRSFIKKTTLGAVAAANASLLSGLVSAGDGSQEDCVIFSTWQYLGDEGPFATEQEANTFRDNIDFDVYATLVDSESAYPANCGKLNPIVTQGGPTATVYYAESTGWYVTINGDYTEKYCNFYT